MRTTSRQRNKFIFAGVILLLVAGYFLDAPAKVFAPVARGAAHAASGARDSLGGMFGYFASKKDLENEVVRLRAEVEKASNERAWYQALEEQQTILLSHLDRESYASTSLFLSEPLLVASVTTRPPQTPFDVIIVDAGMVDGVAVGDWVASRGAVLGTVSEVGQANSYVTLLSSPQSTFSVRLGQFDGEAQGLGGGRYRLELPKGQEVKTGDPIVLPTMGLELVGTVASVETKESDPFQVVYFNVPAALAEIQYVDLFKPRR
jgi:cell shape-determining protein MreC